MAAPVVDPVGKIQEFYLDGTRSVPYLTFMSVFSALMKDPVSLTPAEPREDLRETFRAACMAVNVGVVDKEGRAEKRVTEFREKIYTLWKKRLDPAEFAKYEEVINGAMRAKLREKEEKKRVAAQQESESSRRMLAKLGLLEMTEEEAPPPSAADVVASGDAELPARLAYAKRFNSIDEICKAVHGGEMKPLYTPQQQNKEFAKYPLGDREVTVKLAESSGQEYTILVIGIGSNDIPDAGVRLEEFAVDTGYSWVTDNAYIRRTPDLVFTLKMGREVTSLACTLVKGAKDPGVVAYLQRLHRDFGELVERLRT